MGEAHVVEILKTACGILQLRLESVKRIRKTEDKTCQFQCVGLMVVPQVFHDGPIFHPRRYHSVFFTARYGPDELKYVLMSKLLPGYCLSTEVLQNDQV